MVVAVTGPYRVGTCSEEACVLVCMDCEEGVLIKHTWSPCNSQIDVNGYNSVAVSFF